jgi:DNA-binding transcriptional ArsR family regulator
VPDQLRAVLQSSGAPAPYLDTMELLLHPVRLRIVHAVLDGRPFTTSQLCARLPDVSQATIYRHLALLAAGGLVEVAAEERVRGAVERTYRLHPARTAMNADETAAMTTSVVSRPPSPRSWRSSTPTCDGRTRTPLTDSVSYKQFLLWLSDDEKAAFIEDVDGVIRSRMDQGPGPQRRRHMPSTIFFPTDVRTALPEPRRTAA